MRCSHTLGRPKRRADGEQGGSAAKRPKRVEGLTEGVDLEVRKVRALEKLAAQLERVGDRLERMGGEATTSPPLSICATHNSKAWIGPIGIGSPSSLLGAGNLT